MKWWYVSLLFFVVIVAVHCFNLCRDAEDAVSKRDGYDYDGYRLRVEFPRGGSRSGGDRGGSSGGRSSYGDRGGGGRGGGDRGRGAPARRSQYRVAISGTTLMKLLLWEMMMRIKVYNNKGLSSSCCLITKYYNYNNDNSVLPHAFCGYLVGLR